MSKLTDEESLIIPIGIGLLSGRTATGEDGLGLFQFIGMERRKHTDWHARPVIKG
jgi:hypothetical protein